jgi:hypothetical protein
VAALAATPRAPLPDYQRGYSRANYPRGVQQQGMLHSQNYAYRPQERVVQQHYQQRGISQGAAASAAARGDVEPGRARRFAGAALAHSRLELAKAPMAQPA